MCYYALLSAGAGDIGRELLWQIAGEADISIAPTIYGTALTTISLFENSTSRCRHGNERFAHMGESRERIALKLIGISFLILAAYVAFEAVKSLIFREAPEVTYVGIAIAAPSLIVMPILARAKRQIAADLNSRTMRADLRQTDLYSYPSAILLGGLLLNAIFGWWWADPGAAVIMVPIIAKEGVDALRGETCDDCH
ncbi:MAG: cation transporter [Pyrinomonadaceae bacterium]|nr:cation transporter [Acidobacteriota bacterium]